MEKWLEKRSIHTMNLRSVFTAEQQRILERYYENGMTNQSKSCFQLILQCAQETKLDFSVVRTWVGNKRRKLASKADQNGAAPAVSHQHVSCASVAGSLLTAEMAAMRSIRHGPPVTHLLPPQASSSSSSSSPSSSSPLSDVILTGIYANCFNASTHNRTGMKSFPTHSETEPAAHDSADAAVYRSAIAVGMHRKAPIIPGSSALKCSQTLKPFSSRDSAGIAPSWAKQQPSWPQTSPQKPAPAQTQHVFPPGEPSQRPRDPAGRKTRPGEAAEVFSIAMETGDAEDEYAREEELANMAAQMQCSKGSVDGGRSSSAASSSLTDSPGLTERSRPACVLNPSNPAVSGEKGCQTRTSSPSSVPLNLLSQTASRAPCLQVTSNMSAPWLHGNSRKRTLQDRTQFSDRDVFTLKRYWDKGMTSLGSLCREKISAAASELRVDSEIIKTWIGNRRRKYRLMGIEIPPPKGGPVVFPNQCDPHSPHILEEDCLTPELGEASEHNDGASDLYLKEDDDVNDESDGATPAKHVKIEIVEEEDEDDDDDILSSEMEQMQNLLEFKKKESHLGLDWNCKDRNKNYFTSESVTVPKYRLHTGSKRHKDSELNQKKNEEVQFLENELQSQKQKFLKLKSFTKSLLIAVKNKDRKKQRELLASLPQRMNEDWDLGLENHSESGIEMATIQRESSASEEEDTDQMRL